MGIQESYIELENMCESMYEEVGGYEFYRYLFPECEIIQNQMRYIYMKMTKTKAQKDVYADG